MASTCHHQGLLPGQQRHRFSPAADSLGTRLWIMEPHKVAAVVNHQVNLQESWWRRMPIGEGPHRNIAAQRLPPASEPAGRRS